HDDLRIGLSFQRATADWIFNPDCGVSAGAWAPGTDPRGAAVSHLDGAWKRLDPRRTGERHIAGTGRLCARRSILHRSELLYQPVVPTKPQPTAVPRPSSPVFLVLPGRGAGVCDLIIFL